MSIKWIVTDIEGTTTPIDFVHKVLFPFSYQKMPEFIRQHHEDPQVAEALDMIRQTSNQEDNLIPNLDQCIVLLQRWISEDRKHPGLKLIQGIIWKEGYHNRAFTSQIYADVPENLKQWVQDGIKLAIYSSGSVQAQKLLFAHTKYGDLTPLFSDFFDTKVGGKKENASYTEIANQLQTAPGEILFLSDIGAELEAAQDAGMQVVQLLREQVERDQRFEGASDFNQVDQYLKGKLK